jgi:uncharacterized protein YcnI
MTSLSDIFQKSIVTMTTSLAVIIFVPSVAFAHVIITPGQAGVGEEILFNVSVPNEQQTPMTSLRVTVPSGVKEVVPTVKADWIITTTSSSVKNPEVTSITWDGGSIPVGQREDFSFSAQAPAATTDLDWKAYQTYADGTVVHWDQKPAGSDDSAGNAGPYSVTHVNNDLAMPAAAPPVPSSGSNANTALVISLVALVISVSTFAAVRKGKS